MLAVSLCNRPLALAHPDGRVLALACSYQTHLIVDLCLTTLRRLPS